jgi:hypothetical protein
MQMLLGTDFKPPPLPGKGDKVDRLYIDRIVLPTFDCMTYVISHASTYHVRMHACRVEQVIDDGDPNSPWPREMTMGGGSV